MKRKFASKIAIIVADTAAAAAITKALSAKVPATRRFKIAEMVGAAAAWYLVAKVEPHIDAAVDRFFDAREAKKNN